MGWLIIIGFVILIIYVLAKSNKLNKQDQTQQKNDAVELFKPSENQQTEPERIFYDKEQDFFDYSYLSPSEARRELRERKEAGEFLDFDEYGGLMNAIYAGSDESNIEKVKNMSPEKCVKWWQSQMENGKWHTTAVFDAVAEKLKPYHEEYLLKEMDSVTPGRIQGWVNARKKEGYFFSYNAYMKAEKIFRGEIDTRKKKQKPA